MPQPYGTHRAAPGWLLLLLAAVPACGVPDGPSLGGPSGAFQTQQGRQWVIRDPSGRVIGQGYSSQTSGPGGSSSVMFSSTGGGNMQSSQSSSLSGYGMGLGNVGSTVQSGQVMGPGGIQQFGPGGGQTLGLGGIQQSAVSNQAGLGNVMQSNLTSQLGHLTGGGGISQGNITQQLARVSGGGSAYQGNVTNQGAEVWGTGTTEQSNVTSQSIESNVWQ